MTARLSVEYVMPLFRRDTAGEDELVSYLAGICEIAEVTVVDGSDPGLFDRLDGALPAAVRHMRPSGSSLNGKARGAMTGIRTARHDRIVLGDDDVRYTADQLAALATRLESADLVRPQNRYDPNPWHARWDTGRMLVGRALDGDYSGTVGVNGAVLARHGGYDGDVLFENLELERTVRAAGGRVKVARDIAVVRRPPELRHFLRQRVRQAYDDLAQPIRLIAELLLLPIVVCSMVRRRWSTIVGLALLVLAVAERGRRRAGGVRFFPATSVAWAPLWAAERAVTVWIALGLRLRGGVVYNGVRLSRAATPLRTLRRRLAADGRERA